MSGPVSSIIRRTARFVASSIFLCAWTDVYRAEAAEIKIIVNSSIKVSALSLEQLQRVFLLKSNSLPDGSIVEPVLGTGSPAYELFLKNCLGKSDAALSTYYRSLVFTGRALMPKTLASDSAVVAYGSKTKGAMGYVSSDTKTDGVRSLTIK